jgi:cyclophilin family peptidyl-prolyl cis-trans isomerase
MKSIRVFAPSALLCRLLCAADYQVPSEGDWNRPAPEISRVRLDTSKGAIVIELHREWSPHGVDRFYNLVTAGYYDNARFFRVIKDRWAQFGINGDPAVANTWRTQTIPDDSRRESNTRGTVAFAFAVPNGRTTQVFINSRGWMLPTASTRATVRHRAAASGPASKTFCLKTETHIWTKTSRCWTGSAGQ